MSTTPTRPLAPGQQRSEHNPSHVDDEPAGVRDRPRHASGCRPPSRGALGACHEDEQQKHAGLVDARRELATEVAVLVAGGEEKDSYQKRRCDRDCPGQRLTSSIGRCPGQRLLLCHKGFHCVPRLRCNGVSGILSRGLRVNRCVGRTTQVITWHPSDPQRPHNSRTPADVSVEGSGLASSARKLPAGKSSTSASSNPSQSCESGYQTL